MAPSSMFFSRVPLPDLRMHQVFDHDRFGSHELIGQTSIDLEDRWFSRNWHNLESQDSFATEKRQTEGPFKPLEVRDLMVPTSSNPQGQVPDAELILRYVVLKAGRSWCIACVFVPYRGVSQGVEHPGARDVGGRSVGSCRGYQPSVSVAGLPYARISRCHSCLVFGVRIPFPRLGNVLGRVVRAD